MQFIQKENEPIVYNLSNSENLKKKIKVTHPAATHLVEPETPIISKMEIKVDKRS